MFYKRQQWPLHWKPSIRKHSFREIRNTLKASDFYDIYHTCMRNIHSLHCHQISMLVGLIDCNELCCLSGAYLMNYWNYDWCWRFIFITTILFLRVISFCSWIIHLRTNSHKPSWRQKNNSMRSVCKHQKPFCFRRLYECKAKKKTFSVSIHNKLVMSWLINGGESTYPVFNDNVDLLVYLVCSRDVKSVTS